MVGGFIFKGNDVDRLAKAKELRAEAERLEKEAFDTRTLPPKWKIGMRVRFLRPKEWAWSAGSEATVTRLSPECRDRAASEYQVFWTSPDGGGATWWTTPSDVEWVESHAR